MENYKDKYGKTRVGVFLQNVAPDLLNVAGNLTGIGALEWIGDVIDGSNELTEKQKIDARLLLERDKMEAEQITLRHESDMTSDSWLSKNIRPLTLAFLLLLAAGLAVADSASASFEVDEAYVSMLKSMSLTAVVFYFGGREVQKGILNVNFNKKKNG
jgi:hypothetical protein